ncbi:MAG: G1 family glutamic endopeptidase [Solirubrobacteraceae bacterium]|jgi:hypothetical protein
MDLRFFSQRGILPASAIPLARLLASRLTRSALICGGVASAVLWAAAGASAAVSVSSNWAGYALTRASGASPPFRSVSGSWTQPGASCPARRQTYSAVWVGLGGFSRSSRALEQIGTEADCSRSGGAVYSTWLELVPAPPVKLALKVTPGDRITASVTVAGHGVTLRIRDLSSGASYGATHRVAATDVSSAEWVVEAPSVCLATGACLTLPLTDFGVINFSGVSATAAKHTGTIGDRDWAAAELELQQAASRGPGFPAGPHAFYGGVTTVAAPSPTSAGGFSVSWQQETAQTEQPSLPTLPGLGDGPP